MASLAGFGVLALSAGSASALTDFTGAYDPIHWTLTSLGNGSVSTSPLSITLFSSNTGVMSTINTDYTAVAIGSGMVMFDWAFANPGADTNDTFAFLYNGLPFPITSTPGTSGVTTAFGVFAGDVFGFRITSDNQNGPSSATITNFCAPVPEPSAALVFALGLGTVGCAVRQRRFRVEGNLAS